MVPSIEEVGTTLGSMMKVRMKSAAAASTSSLRAVARQSGFVRDASGQSRTVPHLRGKTMVGQRSARGNQAEALEASAFSGLDFCLSRPQDDRENRRRCPRPRSESCPNLQTAKSIRYKSQSDHDGHCNGDCQYLPG